MKSICLMALGMLTAACALADAPAADPLDVIANQLAGSWNVEEKSFDSEFSREGSQSYTLVRECKAAEQALTCTFTANGQLQLAQRFTWDAGAKAYRVDEVVGGHPQPPLKLSIQGNTWTYLQETHDRAGTPIHYRILMVFRTSSGVSYSTGFSRNGTDWVMMTKGTQIKGTKT